MRHNLRGLTAALLLILWLPGALGADSFWSGASGDLKSDVILGVLEDHPGVYAGAPNYWRVRAVFEKAGDQWQAFPNPCHDLQCLKTLPAKYPAEVNWTIAFEGTNLGQVTGRTPSEFPFYASVGCQEITSSVPVPTVGTRSSEYSGFLSTPVFRPLVAVSKPHYKDPEGWKPAHLSAESLNALHEQFRRQFPRVLNCRNPNENTPKPWAYQDNDIKTGKAYSSRLNWSLAALSLTGWACDGPQETDGPFIDHWYALTPTGTIIDLGSGMQFLDAGDYDGDGKSEVLFSSRWI